MKNITALLSKGNLTPRERALLFVASVVSEDRDGKKILTEANKRALSEGWVPKDNVEAREYNRYSDGWNAALPAQLNAYTTYLTAMNGCLAASKILDYVLLKNRYSKRAPALLKESFTDIAQTTLGKKIDDNDALSFVLKLLGLELDYTIYLLAFETAGEGLQKDLLALYPDAKAEQSYLEQEEMVYNLFNGKNELAKEAKEKLARLMADSAYSKYAQEWRFGGYYADLPLLDVVKQWADYAHIYTDEEIEQIEKEGEEKVRSELTQKIQEYAKAHGTDAGELIRQTIVRWLDEGLFTKVYVPMFNSEGKRTCNAQDTKLPHKEVFKEWLKVKRKTEQTIRELIDAGKLELEKRDKVFKNPGKIIKGAAGQNTEGEDDELFRQTQTLITGESLYGFEGDFTFVKDFKEQADDFKILGRLALYLQQCSFVEDYATLLAFKELFQRLSKTFDIDLTYRINDYIDSLNNGIELLRLELLAIGDDIQEAGYRDKGVYYMSESFLDDLITLPIDDENIKAKTGGRVADYFKKLEGILGDDF